MYRTTFLFILILLSANLFSQTKKHQSSKETADIFLQSSLQKHIHTLAFNERLEDSTNNGRGRLKGTNYLISEYKKWGIEPLGDSNTYAQHFKIDEGLEIKEGSFLSVNGISLKPEVDYWPFPFCADAHFSGTATWGGLEENEPFLYDLKDILAANINNANFNLLKFIYNKAKGLAIKQTTALLVYNSSETNDSLTFSPSDTSAILPIPVVYITKLGIEKMKNESIIANALDGHLILGKNIFDGNNTIGFIDNGADNTIIISSYFNGNTINKSANLNPENINGTIVVLELARLLKELCGIGNKNGNKVSKAFNFKNNNYCFINICYKNEGFYGSNYFLEHLSLKASKINYLINIDKFGNSTDSIIKLNIGGLNSSLTWKDSSLPSNSLINLTPINDVSNKNLNLFYNKNIPFLYFNTLNKSEATEMKTSVVNDVSFINYILQLIGKTNDKGKLIFNKNDN